MVACAIGRTAGDHVVDVEELGRGATDEEIVTFAALLQDPGSGVLRPHRLASMAFARGVLRGGL